MVSEDSSPSLMAGYALTVIDVGPFTTADVSPNHREVPPMKEGGVPKSDVVLGWQRVVRPAAVGCKNVFVVFMFFCAVIASHGQKRPRKGGAPRRDHQRIFGCSAESEDERSLSETGGIAEVKMTVSAQEHSCCSIGYPMDE